MRRLAIKPRRGRARLASSNARGPAESCKSYSPVLPKGRPRNPDPTGSGPAVQSGTTYQAYLPNQYCLTSIMVVDSNPNVAPSSNVTPSRSHRVTGGQVRLEGRRWDDPANSTQEMSKVARAVEHLPSLPGTAFRQDGRGITYTPVVSQYRKIWLPKDPLEAVREP
jgi:hypothetical protein